MGETQVQGAAWSLGGPLFQEFKEGKLTHSPGVKQGLVVGIATRDRVNPLLLSDL